MTPDAGRATPDNLGARDVFRRASSSTVVVLAKTVSGWRQGSGVFVGPRLVVTNHHVVRDEVVEQKDHPNTAWQPDVYVASRTSARRADILSRSEDEDLALLEVDLPQKAEVAVLRVQPPDVGERVFAIGSPMGLDFTISEGLLSGLRPLGGERGQMLQTSAAISAGSSGGGLFDADARLIGITTLGSTGAAQNLNFAIPADRVAQFISEADGGTSGTPAPDGMARTMEGGLMDHDLGLRPAGAEKRRPPRIELRPRTIGGCPVRIAWSPKALDVPSGKVVELQFSDLVGRFSFASDCPGLVEISVDGEAPSVESFDRGETVRVVIPR
jgi:S1-C subfamily serine protease